MDKQQETINLTDFETLFKRHYAELCGFANKYLEDLEAAEEVVQAFFVKLWENKEKLQEIQSVRSYLFSSVKNACYNQLKHIKIREEYKAHNQREMDQEKNNVEDEFAASELEDKIRQSIDRLPEGRRKIFIMSRFEGLKYKEIAEKLNISIKTVENQMGSAIKHLKTDLADYILFLALAFFISG
ncbi:MAG: RNA polymerase sigma-70 factor [Flavobacteriales bacterium]|nr:RNA polymerase sigma-70 factor [Flavobacteriales bacterium]